MNIIEQPVMFSTTADNPHTALALFLIIVALVLFGLTLRFTGRTSGSSLPARYLQADYWVNRARRRHRLLRQFRAGRRA
ncbi:MAG: hypothetical protein V2I26_18045 [Halieaceae bacterium]|jgi:hypothetical protein|nr:hypothetical protein [Halieaceae bacterium]